MIGVASIAPPLFGPQIEPRLGAAVAHAITREGAGFVPCVLRTRPAHAFMHARRPLPPSSCSARFFPSQRGQSPLPGTEGGTGGGRSAAGARAWMRERAGILHTRGTKPAPARVLAGADGGSIAIQIVAQRAAARRLRLQTTKGPAKANSSTCARRPRGTTPQLRPLYYREVRNVPIYAVKRPVESPWVSRR